MATKAQIKANRENARKSTGPRTDEGKAAVSKNAVKHGLFAEEAVIFGEDPADYDALHDEILAELAPSGVMETLLAERVVSLTWRLHRAERLMNQVINELIDKRIKDPFPEMAYDMAKQMLGDEFPEVKLPYPEGQKPDLSFGKAVIRDYASTRAIDKLALYERRIENSLFKTIKELDKRKLARQTTEDGQGMMDEGGGTIDEGRGMKDELKKQSQSVSFGVPRSEFGEKKFAKQTQLPANGRKFEIHPTGMKPGTQNSGLSRAKPRERRTQKFAKQSQLVDELDITSCNKRDYENISSAESYKKHGQVKANLKMPAVGSGIDV
jgi:hypothetical protein